MISTEINGIKVGDIVLVRDADYRKWTIDIFNFYNDSNDVDFKYTCSRNNWRQCIPYKGNEKLFNTIDNFKIKVKESSFVRGDRVIAWNDTKFSKPIKFHGFYVAESDYPSIPVHLILPDGSNKVEPFLSCEKEKLDEEAASDD